MKRHIQHALAAILILIVGASMFSPDAAEPKEIPPAPSKDFIAGFEAGVRYGLLARAATPDENNITKITEAAKKWYWIVVVDAGRLLQEARVVSPIAVANEIPSTTPSTNGTNVVTK